MSAPGQPDELLGSATTLHNPTFLIAAELLEDFPKLLQAVREQRGLGQIEAAMDAGVSYSQWGRWERGQVSPSLEVLVVLLRWCAGESEQKGNAA